MPQMAPLMWLPLMISFSCLLIITMIIMFFYSPVYNTQTSSTQSSFKLGVGTINWPW